MGFNIQAAIDAAFANADAEIVALNGRIADLEHQVELLLAAADKAQADLAAAQKTISERDSEIANKKTVIADLEAEVERLEARIAELEAGNPDPEPEPEPEEPEEPAPGGFWQGLNSKFPTAATVGPRIARVADSRTNVSGKISGKKFTKTVIPAAGTEFEDCEFTGSGWGVDADSKKVKFTHCLFKGSGTAAILGVVTAINCDISGYEDGIKAQGEGVVIRGNYIHDLGGGASAHNDGIQVQEGKNGLIEMNTIKAKDTSAIMLQPMYGIDGYIIRWNNLSGAGFNLRVENGYKGCKNVEVYENAIERGGFGYHDGLPGASKVYGNIDAVTGKAI